MKLLRMEFHNLFSYKDGEINFSKLNLALFKGESGTGKSSPFDILCWTWYGQTARKKYKKILRDSPDKPKSGYSIVYFTVGEKEYKVERHIGKRKILRVFEDGELIKLRTPTLNQERINEIIGVDFKTFLNIAYFSQGDVGKFLTNESGERIKIITDMVTELADIDVVRTSIDKDSKKNSYETENLKGQLLAHKEITSSIDIASIRKEKKVSESSLKKYLAEMASVGCELTSIIKKKNLQKEYGRNKEQYDNQLQYSKDNLRSIKQKIENIETKKKSHKSMELKYDKLTNQLENYDGVKSELKIVGDEISKSETYISNQKIKIEINEKEIIALGKVIKLKNSNCPTCKSIIDEDNIKHLNALSHTKSLDNEKYKVYISSKIKDLKKHIEKRKRIEVKLNGLNKLLVAKNDLKNKLKRFLEYDDEIKELKSEFISSKKKFNKQLSNAKNKVSELKLKIKSLDKFDSSNESKVQERYDELDLQIEVFESKINKLKSESDRYYISIKKITSIEKQLLSYSESDKIIDFWKQALPKIKVDMISGIIPFLESETNKYLSQILPGKMVRFIADSEKANNKLDIMIYDIENDVERIYEGWCGGEKIKMSISVYLALNKLASIRSGKSINFIILDEKFSAVDSRSRLVLMDMLKNEYKDRNIWAITHVENLDNEFEQVVTTKMVNGLSSMVVKGI